MTEIEYLRFYLERKIKLDEENLKLDTDLLEALKLEEQAREQEKKSDNKEYDNLPETFKHERAAELDKLPWKDFQNGNGSWIKAELAPQWLLNILKGIKRPYDFEGLTYRFSGDKDQFVNRYHTKKEKT